MPKRTRDHDSWLMERLGEPEVAAIYLSGILDESPEKFYEALGEVARAYQMKKLATESGLTRENLYRSLSLEGNPTRDTIESVFRVLNLEYSGVRVRGGGERSSGSEVHPKKAKPRSKKDNHKIDPNVQGAFPFANLSDPAPSTSPANRIISGIPWGAPNALINAHYPLIEAKLSKQGRGLSPLAEILQPVNLAAMKG